MPKEAAKRLVVGVLTIVIGALATADILWRISVVNDLAKAKAERDLLIVIIEKHLKIDVP